MPGIVLVRVAYVQKGNDMNAIDFFRRKIQLTKQATQLLTREQEEKITALREELHSLGGSTVIDKKDE